MVNSLIRRAGNAVPQGLKDKLRGAVHPAQRSNVERLFSRGERDLGLLSVVIPVFNVEAYLSEALTSVIGQSYRKLEILVVDDGSTDGSLEIVQQFAKHDSRIKVLSQEHIGNGRARNLAIAAATGEFLTFADSDDVVAPGAYALMLKTLTASGSDFVVGSSDRLIGSKRQPTKLSSAMHKDKKINVRVEDFPAILDDVFLWNKVFRRSFWDAKVGPIPEDVLYEDQETTARAFVRSQGFDVLQEVVYSWRQRSNGSSITQGKRSISDLRDRLSIATDVTRFMGVEAGPAATQKWYLRLFGTDLVPYYEQVPYTSVEYWDALTKGVSGLIELFATTRLDTDRLAPLVDPHARVLRDLAVTKSRDAFETVLVDRMETGTGYSIVLAADGLLALPNYRAKLPDVAGGGNLALDPSLLALESSVTFKGYGENGSATFAGYAFVRGLRDSLLDVKIAVFAGSTEIDEHSFELTFVSDALLDAKVNDPFASHQHSAFLLSIKDATLAKQGPSEFEVRISAALPVRNLHSSHRVAPSKSGVGHWKSGAPRAVGFGGDASGKEFWVDLEWHSGDAHKEVFLATRKNSLKPQSSSKVSETVWRYVFALSGELWGRPVMAPPSGAYTLRFAVQGSSPQAVVMSAEMSWGLPELIAFRYANVQFWSTPQNTVAVTVGPPLGTEERGKFRQRELQQSFASQVLELRQDSVVFESFGGKFCTDSPKALSDELHRQSPEKRIYWSIEDYSVSFPHYAIPVVRGSRAWFDAVRHAALLVNNNNFPFYFRKSPEQFYLQTWHGTPLKKIGLDAPTQHLSLSYRRLMDREATFWDLLLAQNDFSAQVFPQAFGYSGRILTAGYPRNDVLADALSAESRLELRASLGIRTDQEAVLYAPTWRDNAKDATGQHQWVGYIDFEKMRQALGDRVVFLVRGHHNVLGSSTGVAANNTIDVSTYPEINDLILASDTLITDYSSIMFDYINIGRPILFFTGDAVEYEQSTRGTYVAAEKLSIGKTVADHKSLVEALSHLGQADSCRNDISTGEHNFVANDDGEASRRVVAAVQI